MSSISQRRAKFQLPSLDLEEFCELLTDIDKQDAAAHHAGTCNIGKIGSSRQIIAVQLCCVEWLQPSNRMVMTEGNAEKRGSGEERMGKTSRTFLVGFRCYLLC